MKYIIDIPEEMVVKSALKGLTLGISMRVPATQQHLIFPTDIPLTPYSDVKDKPKDEEEHLLDDGTLVLYTEFDLTDVSRINVCQIGTHYGDLYYRDEDD